MSRSAAVVRVIVGSAFAVVTLAASGQTLVAPKASTGTGIIAGRVVEAGSQTPITEAIVSLFGPPDPVARSLGERRRAMVDPQGRFVFTGLPPGAYGVTAVQFGYVSGAFGKIRPSVDQLQSIDLADGQRFTDATILMWRFGSIAGRVVDEAGEPMVGVRVTLFTRTFQGGEVGWQPVYDGGTTQSFYTDDRGIYRAAGLLPGEYAVAVPATVSTFPVDVMRDIQTSRVNLGVGETAPLGDVRNLQIGNQILTTMSRSPIPPAREGGPLTVYETTFHPDVTSVDRAVAVRIAPGESRRGVDIRLVARPTVRVTGRIVGPDGPLPLTPFRVVRAGGTPATEAFGLETATGITDARGQFTLLGVPRGSYILRVSASLPVSAPGGRPIPISAEHALVVGDSDVADVVVTARAGATISGRVEVRGSQPVAASALQLGVESLYRGYEGRVDANYRFSMTLPPGRYLVLVRTPTSVCLATSGGKDISDDWLVVGEQNVTDILVVCTDGGTSISGIVSDDRGQPDPRTRVAVFPTDRRFWTGAEFRKRRNASAFPSPDGRYRIKDLPPGDYFVAALTDAAADNWQLPAFRESLLSSATRITLGASESKSLDLRTLVIR